MKDFCLDFSDYLVNQKNVSDNTLTPIFAMWSIFWRIYRNKDWMTLPLLMKPKWNGMFKI